MSINVGFKYSRDITKYMLIKYMFRGQEFRLRHVNKICSINSEKSTKIHEQKYIMIAYSIEYVF